MSSRVPHSGGVPPSQAGGVPVDLTRARSLFRRALEAPRLTGGVAGHWEAPACSELTRLFPEYEILELVGRGGMGAVYKARQLSLDRLVAIKILPLELSVEPGFEERFRREAQAMARLSHPNIVSVFDFGETSEGGFYIVMEYVEGADLQAAITGGKMGFADGIRLTRQICDGLGHAHGEGFVHRDVKPGNILLDAHGNVRISDFGLSRLTDGAEPEILETVAGGVVGTPAYIAPEQLEDGSAADHRADIYSLGVMLYELLTGELPRGVFQSPSQRVEEIDPQIDIVVERAMQSTPDLRYQSAAEMGEALDPVAVARSRRSRFVSFTRLAVAVIAVAGTICGLVWFSKTRGGGEGVGEGMPAALQVGKPFTNSLGMELLPVGQGGVYFCAHETRIRDYSRFIDATGHPMDSKVWYYEGTVAKETSEYSWRDPGYEVGPDHPVTAVSWADAIRFCEWLTDRDRRAGLIPEQLSYRLPAEREWDAVAGATVYPWGNQWPPPEGAGNFAGAEMGTGGWPRDKAIVADWSDGYTRSAPVGSFAADSSGLFDVAGNVNEWLVDKGVDDPSRRVVMGGSWMDGAEYALSIRHRTPLLPEGRYTVVGFRIVLAERVNSGAHEWERPGEQQSQGND